MCARRRNDPREKDLTSRFFSGNIDEDQLRQQQRFSSRNKQHQQNKIEKTALLRAAEEDLNVNLDALPVGQVILVHSLFSQVESNGRTFLCVIRKTLAKLSDTSIVVGDLVKFRDNGTFDESGRPEAVIEQVIPRKTILTRADSFKQLTQHPIVANAEQMLIVVSLKLPEVKWSLVDRMLIAANAGGLTPLVCLNKVDLAPEDLQEVRAVLAHYRSLDIATLETSVTESLGLEELKSWLRNKTTVLAGHSGVGKSSLIRALQPALDIRIGEISGYTGKGRHTTTSARRYPLDFGGYVIDTPGVKLFGLWAVTQENLIDFFPDIENDSAPEWRKESYQRILDSLKS